MMMPTAASLMDDLVEEFLIRLPPDDPASLVNASLVCKRWSRLIAGRVFRRKFRKIHRAKLLHMARGQVYRQRRRRRQRQ
ncbi:uncharacterized protein LOC100279176 [Zea mays]|jgi:hypothetical protein|nr:uncharacterized protein LOC100279176 [Zea mays]ACG43978.1 hypothetical protein [Zea mays]ACG44121.1 hypothetical protein [Zea mays]|eukprot:NP_001316034.1 uncharacterized protein LOC100279176 [Zea mays]